MEVIDIPSSPDSTAPVRRIQPARKSKTPSVDSQIPDSQSTVLRASVRAISTPLKSTPVRVHTSTSPMRLPSAKRPRLANPINEVDPIDDRHNESLMTEWKKMEEQLRCDICKQLLDVPVSLKCFHTFCSFCIRRYLESSGNEYCPCCRVPATSTDIRLEPRLAGVLAVLGKDRGAVRKSFRERIRTRRNPDHPVVSRNETFNKQADMADIFKSTKGDPVGRTLLPLYKNLKDRQLRDMVVVTDGLEVPDGLGRDDLIRLHKEFVFTVQAGFDAVRMGMYPHHPPTKEGLAKVWNAEARSKASSTQRRFVKVKTDAEKRRETADKSESVSALTALAGKRMQDQLREALRVQRGKRLRPPD